MFSWLLCLSIISLPWSRRGMKFLFKDLVCNLFEALEGIEYLLFLWPCRPQFDLLDLKPVEFSIFLGGSWVPKLVLYFEIFGFLCSLNTPASLSWLVTFLCFRVAWAAEYGLFCCSTSIVVSPCAGSSLIFCIFGFAKFSPASIFGWDSISEPAFI